MGQSENADREDKYLMFILDNEEYAIEVPKIKEVINPVEITEVPNTSPYVEGVISLRGVIVPVLNIKRYLEPSDGSPSKRGSIIIISYKKYVAGLPVDSVEGVRTIASDAVTPLPHFMKKEKMEFLKGVVEYKDRTIMVLKISALLDRLRYEN